MLTDKDIKKLIKTNKEVFATKKELKTLSIGLLNELFATKKDIEGFRKETRKSFSELLTAIDAYAAKSRYIFPGNADARA